MELFSWKSSKDLTDGDGGVIKTSVSQDVATQCNELQRAVQGVFLQVEEGTGWEKPDKAAEVCIAFEAKLNDKVDCGRYNQMHHTPQPDTIYNCTCAYNS